jgi:uncharacterized protein YukJ
MQEFMNVSLTLARANIRRNEKLFYFIFKLFSSPITLRLGELSFGVFTLNTGACKRMHSFAETRFQINYRQMTATKGNNLSPPSEIAESVVSAHTH